MDKIKIKLDKMPLSINEAYRGRRFKTLKLKNYKQDILFNIRYRRVDTSALKFLKGEKLTLHILIDSPTWVTIKEGTIRRSDITNRIKVLEDAIFEALGIDDSQVWNCLIFKGEKKEVKTHVVIEKHKDFMLRHPDILDIFSLE